MLSVTFTFRFLVLGRLLSRRQDIEQILRLYPGIPNGLAQSLESNYIAPYGATVYKCIVRKLNLSRWEFFFKMPLLSSLLSKNEASVNNSRFVQTPQKARNFYMPTIYLLTEIIGCMQQLNFCHNLEKC